MYSTINKFKYGECTVCNDGLEKECHKVGKSLICLYHYKDEKDKQQLAKAREKVLLRGEVKEQNYNGIDISLQGLINDIDFVFSRYVRIREATPEGLCNCFICNRVLHFSMADAAHYVKRSCLYLRWDIRNVKINCKTCNQYLDGNYDQYTNRLEEYESGITETLLSESREPFKPTRYELQQLLIDYRSKLKLVESKLINHKK